MHIIEVTKAWSRVRLSLLYCWHYVLWLKLLKARRKVEGNSEQERVNPSNAETTFVQAQG